MTIEKFVMSSEYISFPICQALNRFAESRGFKPMRHTKHIENRVNFMKRIGIRGDLTDKGIRFSATGSMDPDTLMRAHKEKARQFIPIVESMKPTSSTRSILYNVRTTPGYLTWATSTSLYRLVWANYEVELDL